MLSLFLLYLLHCWVGGRRAELEGRVGGRAALPHSTVTCTIREAYGVKGTRAWKVWTPGVNGQRVV